MSYYTTIGKTVSCPYLDMKVTLTGKYRFIGESCQFSYATCEIVEKSKLPPYEQLEDTKYYVCPRKGNCELLSNFEKGIDLKKHGFSSQSSFSPNKIQK